MHQESAEAFIARTESKWRKKPVRKKFYDVAKEGYFYLTTEKWTFHIQHNLPEKIFIIERLRIDEIEGQVRHKNIKVGDIEYRLCYYIINKKGKWHWGQNCPLIPGKDLKELLDKAKKEGTIC